MIVIKLDTPVWDGDVEITELRIETPIRAGHLLKAMRTTTSGSLLMELFIESVCGVSHGFLEQLTIEDFAKVHAAVGPFLASFQRPHLGAQT